LLQQAAQGVPVGDLCRKVGLSEQSFYRWNEVDGSRQPSEARELKQLRDEVTKLKRLVADCRWTRSCSRMSSTKSFEARQGARRGDLLDGTLRRQCTPRVPGAPGNAIIDVLQEPAGSAH